MSDKDDDDRAEGKIVGFPDPPMDLCPVVFLGHFDKYVVFAMPEGQIREEKASDIARLLKVDIYNAKEGQVFLNYWRDAEDELKKDLAAIWFVRQCRAAGYWDRTRPLRGLGVWPGTSGAVVLNRGCELWTFWPGDDEPEIASIAEAMRARTSGPIYALRAASPAPDEPASEADGQWVRDKLDHWNWEAIGEDGLTGADLAIGFMGCGLLGAVAPFRAHLLLYAMFGAGKTTLMRFVHACLSALSGDVIDSFTRAGLANDLAGNARPVIIDEAESSPMRDGPGPVEEAMELIRRMATGQGATRKMGEKSGGSVTQTAVGAVMMGAVNPVRLSGADASRIAEAKLLPLDRPRQGGEPAFFKPASDDEIEKIIKTAQVLAPQLLGRALDGAQRYLADVTRLKAAFRAQGQSSRAADLVAALAAGRRLILKDHPLDEAEAEDEAVFWRGLISSREEAEAVSNTGADCLAHLLAWPSGVHRDDRIVSLGELVAKWWKAEAAGTVGDYLEVALREFGIKPVVEQTPAGKVPYLQVANRAPVLNRVFDRTPWRDWRKALGYLAELGPAYAPRAVDRPVRFGVGVQSRAIAIPLDPWLEHWDGEPVARTAERTGQGDDE